MNRIIKCFFMLVFLGRSAPLLGEEKYKNGDIVCGPRCVQHVLMYYGQTVDLTSLVDELQGDDLEKGSTLADMEVALKGRDIHTSLVRLPEGAALKWPHPAILHLGSTDELGHFVVQLPSNNASDVCVWAGLSGTHFAPPALLIGRASGAVLLTSPSAINDDELDGCLVRVRPLWRVLAYVITGCVLATILLRSLILKAQRRYLDG